MKEFNWETCKNIHRPEIVRFFKENHGKKLSESEFVRKMHDLRTTGKAKGSSKNHNPSRLKAEYQSLVKRYGFFTKQFN